MCKIIIFLFLEAKLKNNADLFRQPLVTFARVCAPGKNPRQNPNLNSQVAHIHCFLNFHIYESWRVSSSINFF